MASRTPNATDALLALAERQHGVVSRRQLRDAGLSESGIGRAAARGRLHPVFRGVYAVGRPGIGERGRMMAAVLACGPGAVVSHRSAAALLGLIDRAPAVVDVTAPAERGRRLDGIRAHGCRPPAGSGGRAGDGRIDRVRAERGTCDGIPCTAPARSLVDLAGVVRPRTLRGAFERAAHLGLLDLDAIEAVMRRGRRRGAPAVRDLVAEWRAPSLPTRPLLRSPFEAKLLPLLAAAGLPTPLVNATVATPNGPLEVDLLWPSQRLVVEADGRSHHGTAAAFERDRRRDRELLRTGYTTLRVTWRQAEREPEAVVQAIRSHLS